MKLALSLMAVMLGGPLLITITGRLVCYAIERGAAWVVRRRA